MTDAEVFALQNEGERCPECKSIAQNNTPGACKACDTAWLMPAMDVQRFEDMLRDANRYRYIREHMEILDELPLCEDHGELDQAIDFARGRG